MRIAINANNVLKMFNALREPGQPNSGVGDGLPFLVPPYGLTKNDQECVMNLKNLTLAVGLALFALPMTVWAQDADAPAGDEAASDEESTSNWSWNLAATSDYVFRGVTQTNFEPALQGGFDYSFGDSGWYVGVWGSNVDFADSDGPDLELDSYIGYNTDLSDDWNLDLSLVRYTYIGENDVYGSIDYNELIGKLTWNEMLTFTLGYANDYANSDYSSLYYNLSGAWDVGNDFSISAGVGHTDFSDGVDGYTDYNIGVSRQFGPVNAALNYYDTDIDGPRVSDRVVLTLSIEG